MLKKGFTQRPVCVRLRTGRRHDATDASHFSHQNLKIVASTHEARVWLAFTSALVFVASLRRRVRQVFGLALTPAVVSHRAVARDSGNEVWLLGAILPSAPDRLRPYEMTPVCLDDENGSNTRSASTA